MKTHSLVTLLSLGLACAALAQTPPASGELVNANELDAGSLKTENEATVSVAEEAGAKVVKISFPDSKGYPGVDFPAPEGNWDLAAFRGVSAEVTNNGPAKLGLSMRVENPGDWKQSPWNSNVLWLAPGGSGTLTVNFGESFGKPGYALDPGRISKIKLFVNAPKVAGEVILQSLKAVEK